MHQQDGFIKNLSLLNNCETYLTILQKILHKLYLTI